MGKKELKEIRKEQKKARKREKKVKKFVENYFKSGWTDYEFFVRELDYRDSQYLDGTIALTEVAQRLKKYITFKKMLALVLLDRDNCVCIPREVIQKSCFLELLAYIDHETGRYAIMRAAYLRHIDNSSSIRVVK